mmetsp:Transcript_18883/g.26293  ORF Transcript_18883/g.26293 Transcript_18883/m.26293 type:complete len:297 (+) Transcript_18883:206-1096(+)
MLTEEDRAEAFFRYTAYMSAGLWLLHLAAHEVMKLTSARYRNIPAILAKVAKPEAGEDEPPLPIIGAKSHVLTCQDIVVIPTSTAITFLYLLDLMRLSRERELRWAGFSHAFLVGASLHCAFSVYELSIYFFLGKKLEFFLHHILVFALFAIGTIKCQFQFYLGWAGLVEITNVFLSSLSILGRMDMKQNPLYLASGVGLYISYVLTRLFSVALCLSTLLYDSLYLDQRLWESTSVFFFFFCVVSCIVIYFMSAMWFTKIHSGLMKHLNGTGPQEAGADMDNLSGQSSKTKHKKQK